jgi:hypothetical protein
MSAVGGGAPLVAAGGAPLAVSGRASIAVNSVQRLAGDGLAGSGMPVVAGVGPGGGSGSAGSAGAGFGGDGAGSGDGVTVARAVEGGSTEVAVGMAGLVPAEVVQRADAPSAASGAVSGAPAGHGGAGEPEELLKKLFDPLLRRIKAELRLDRDRRGMVTDLHR